VEKVYAEMRVEGRNPRNPGKACEGYEKMVRYSMSEVLDFEKRKGKRSMEPVFTVLPRSILKRQKPLSIIGKTAIRLQ